VLAYTHPLVCGPVFASHPLDVQTFPHAADEKYAASVGPPAINVEVRLDHVNEAAYENGAAVAGDVR
jgi:long-chain acyl-CoA synthetase